MTRNETRNRDAVPDDTDDPVFEADDLFDPDHYLAWAEELLGPDLSKREVEFLVETLDPDPGDRLLDVPCGHGRHANRLAERGYHVSGLDRSDPFLDRAREDARDRGVADHVEYVQGDMRELPWDADEFDAAYNVFTSFGFFDDAGNRRVLDEFARVLRPGGRLVLEMADRDDLLYDYCPESVTEMDDGYMFETREFDPETGRNHTERVVVHDGETHEATYSVRLYSYTELRSLLTETGFEVREVYGSLEGNEYELGTGRMCVVAERER